MNFNTLSCGQGIRTCVHILEYCAIIKEYHIKARRSANNYTKGNTAQSTPDGFARHLLAYFPSYRTNFPCNTTVLLRQIYAI